jgi:HAD superfamily hydrolase (TIGR01509 family)
MTNLAKQAIKAVIFDMDGVLVDSEEWWFEETKKWLSRLIQKPWDNEEEARITGKSVPDIYRALRKLYKIAITEQEFFNGYNKLARNVYLKKCSLMPRVLEILSALKSRNMPIALSSSSPHSWIKMMVTRFEIAQYFTVTASSEDVGFRGKPAPDIYLYTAKKLGVKPAECIAIEDSKNGILSASTAGMIAVWYKTPYNKLQEPASANAIITDLMEAASFVDSIVHN